MLTKIIKITKETTKYKAEIEEAANVITAGGLVVFPTETVYGLGADATDEEAVKRIYVAKGRPSDNPLIVHVADPFDAQRYAFVDDVYTRLAKNSCPDLLQ